MDQNKIAEVLKLLKNKHEYLQTLQGTESTLKEMVKIEILAIENVLFTLGIKFELLSCYKCGEPETAAKDELDRFVCWKCMMNN